MLKEPGAPATPLALGRSLGSDQDATDNLSKLLFIWPTVSHEFRKSLTGIQSDIPALLDRNRDVYTMNLEQFGKAVSVGLSRNDHSGIACCRGGRLRRNSAARKNPSRVE